MRLGCERAVPCGSRDDRADSQRDAVVDLPLAGAAAEEGRQMLDAVRLVVSQAGYRVGKLGVDVRASDDADPATGRSDPARCRAGAPRAAADPTAIAVIGTYESSCTMLALPALTSAGLALVSPVNSDPALATPGTVSDGVLVRLAPSDSLQGTAAAVEARALGAHRLVRPGGSLGSVAATRAGARRCSRREQADDRGARADAAVCRRRGGRGRADAGRARRLDLVRLGSGPGVVAVLRALVPSPRARPKPPPPPILLGSDALYRQGLLQTAGAAAEGLHLTSEFVPPDCLGGAGADFSDAFARQFGQPGIYTAYAADAARLVLAALRRSDGTRAGVLRALFRTRAYPGLIGTVGIDSDGGSTLARLGVFRVHNGSFRFERVLDLSKQGS